MMATNLALAIVFGVCGAIVFLFLYTLITVYYHACNETFFEDMIIHKKNVDAKKETKTVEAPAAKEEVVEEAPVAEETAAPAKAAPKKTAAKKAPAKKTTAAKKSTAKKTTTTKKTTK